MSDEQRPGQLPGVPTGWVVTTIGAFVRVRGGFAFKSSWYCDDGVFLIRQAELRGRIVDLSAAKRVPRECLDTHSAWTVRRGDLLVGMSGSIGQVSEYQSEQPALQNQRTGLLQLSRHLSPRFVLVAMEHLAQELVKRGKGVAVQNVSGAEIESTLVNLPPLGEQVRLASFVETQFSRLDAAVAGLKRVQANLKRYRASVLKAAVEGRLVPTEAELARKEARTYEPASALLARILEERRARWEAAELASMKAKGKPPKDDKWKSRYKEPAPPDTKELPELPEGWCWATVESVGDVLLGRQRAPQYLTGEWSRPYLRVANIKDDRIDFSDVEEMDFAPDHFAKYQLLSGDILVSEGQSPHLVGQSAIYKGGIEGLCFQKTLHRFRAVEGGPNTQFVQTVFRAHVKDGVFLRLASITTNIAHLTLIKFQQSRFPLPPAREQERIVKESQRLLSIADEVEADVAKQLARCSRLRQSILKWAFEGKLVDQDPNDEPASVLLERIRAEREAAVAAKPTRTKAGPQKTNGGASPKPRRTRARTAKGAS